MRRYTDIVVKIAAVHVVSPKKGVLHQSTAEIELSAEVQKFLAGHVSAGLANDGGLAGSFKVKGPDRTEGICRSIIASDEDFVSRSATLAKLLYDASDSETSTDTRVSDGTLVVARCTAYDDGPVAVLFVALLKLDPSDAFRAEDSTEGGKAVVKLVLQPNVLPSPRERLQKAAFVRGPGNAYDSIVVDNQRRGPTISAFFLEKFLGVEYVNDDKARTKQLYKTMQRGLEEIKGDLTPEEYVLWDTYMRGQIVGGQVNVDMIVAGLPDPPEARERVTEVINADLPDRVFSTDTGVALQLLKSRRFRGSNGLRVSVPDGFYDQMITAVPPRTDGDDWTITIRSSQWDES